MGQELESNLSPALTQYQAQIAELRRSRHMDYPAMVHIETFAKCNAACSFCPYPTIERQGERMSDSLFEKIIGDLCDIPRDVRLIVSPVKVNEPFLDSAIFDRMAYINEKLPTAKIALTTNASPLTRSNIDRLAGVRNLRDLWISLNDHREAEYEATMKIPYKRTMENLRRLHDMVSNGESNIRVVLSRVGDGSPADQAFAVYAQTAFPRFKSFVGVRGSWVGRIQSNAPIPNIGCTRWFEISIMATGIVSHCCMDGNGDFPIGDVKTQHLLEIYNQPHYRSLREATVSRRDAKPCDQCSFL